MSENVRDYEVSVWTLQDSYLATLKWSNSSHKGLILEPKMSLSDDGTESFSFTIPMYLWVQDGDVMVRLANPIWYTVKDGILMVNMRKIKVIFNKTFGENKDKIAAGERVFEFLITKITESHEEDNPTCSIECEGLAFHELGKLGYKIELSSEVFYDRDNTYYNGNTDNSHIWYDNLHLPHADCPHATLDYWMNDLGIKHARYTYKTVEVGLEFDNDNNATRTLECINGLDTTSSRENLNPTEWYYDVLMDWSSHSTVENLLVDDSTLGLETSSTEEQTNDRIARSSDKVYEDPYVSSWNQDLTPTTMEPAREKERLIDAKESNLYNLTLTIAENFEIFCRYEYSYDARYLITGRKIIFYNTYYARFNDAYLEFLNYPQTTSSVSREYDGTDITTKMYVRPETDDSAVTGQISIIDSNANPTKEDYVMNFDYLHNIGTISDEQYAAIKDYNLKMKHYNEGRKFTGTFDPDADAAIALQDGYYRRGDRIYFKKGKKWLIAGLIALLEQLLAKLNRKTEVDAKLTVAKNSVEEAVKRIEDARLHIGGDSTKLISIDHLNPQPENVSKYTDKDEKEYYLLSLSEKGVFADSIEMYKKWNETDKSFAEYTSDATDIPDASFKDLFSHDDLSFRKWDTENSAANKALKHYMKAAGLDYNTDKDKTKAKSTLNNWYTALKTPDSAFAETEVPKQVIANITKSTRSNVYAGTTDDCSLATDAIGWVLHILGKASYKRLDDSSWRKYVLLVESPTGKTYPLNCVKGSNSTYIEIDTWNAWVACRLQWCLAAQAGVLAKDIFMTKQSDKTYTVSAKTSWATLPIATDSLTVEVNTSKDNKGKVIWTATLSEVGLDKNTASTFEDLKKLKTPHINYQNLLESVGIYHLPNRITSFKVVKDDNGNATGIKKIPISKGETLTKVYLTYLYSPDTYYSNIRYMWEKKKGAAATDEKNYTAEQELLKTSITNLKEVIRIMLKDKFEDTRKFDHLMGPAMRESYWQPEDYRDYGDFYSQHLNTIFFNKKNTNLPKWRDNKVSAGFYWDSELFPEEEKGYYYLGVDTDTKHYYPCINLLKFFKSLEEDDGSSTASETGFSVTIDSDTGANVDITDLISAALDNSIPGENNSEYNLGTESGENYLKNLYKDTIGRGILTADAAGSSGLTGLREQVVGLDELNALILHQLNGWPGTNTTVSNTEVISNMTTVNQMEQFILNFEKLTFSYYTDGFDKLIKKAKYDPSKNEYSIVPNNEAEYAYDNTLFARVITNEGNKDVEWVYKIKYIATTTGKDDKKNVYNESKVERVEADRVYRTVGSRTAEGAFVENDEVKLMFLRRINKDTGNSTIIPVLMLKCLDGVSDDMLHYIQLPVNYDKDKFIARYSNDNGALHRIHPGAQPMIGFYDDSNGSSLTFTKIGDILPKHWINFENSKYKYEVVYPRLKINSLLLKTSTVALTINYDLLKQYEDYYIFTRNTDYLITLKPYTFFELHGTKETVLKKITEEGLGTHYFVNTTSKEAFFLKTSVEAGTNAYGAVSGTNDCAASWSAEFENVDDTAGAGTHTNDTAYVEEVSIVQDLCFRTSALDQILRPIRVTYAISNGGTRTYLDALKVIKENSLPKVTYTVTPNIANSKLIGTLYNRLGQIVGINDTELKFDNVFGYISSVQMDLDKPWEDSIEVKNYTNKFEDLFSSISAQTEEMKKNSGVIAGFASGTLTTALENSITNTTAQVLNSDTIINNLMEEFDGPLVVEDTWRGILEEANLILSSGREGLNELLDLNSANALILGTFVKNIAAQTKPKVYTGDPSAITNFKPGDICYAPDGRVYMAASSDAFMPVYDGNISKIVGASVKWDANAGTVNIEGATLIDIKSGNNIGIAANADINIIGNKSVNIGGATINIGSAVFETTDENGNAIEDSITGGINIVSSYIGRDDDEAIAVEQEPSDGRINTNNHMSGVFIHPEQISLLSSNIIMEGAEKILMYTSDGTAEGTSAFQISTTEGIWMGSGKGIEIYASGASFYYDAEKLAIVREWTIPAHKDETTGATIPELHFSDTTGASVSILPERILMGVASALDASVVRIKPGEVLIASGSLENTTKAVDGTKNGLIGAQFTKNSIGLAVTDSSNNVTSAFLMNAKGITLGAGTNLNLTTELLRGVTSTSWVRIEKDGISLGSLANMYINTNNFKLLTKASESDGTNTFLAIGSNLLLITLNSSPADLAKNKNTSVSLFVGKNGTYINGAIHATKFVLEPDDDNSIPLSAVADSGHLTNSIQSVLNEVLTNVVASTILTYAIHNKSDTPPSSGWKSTYLLPTDSKPYAWTKTEYKNKNGNVISTSYTVTTSDGNLSEVKTLYYLTHDKNYKPEYPTSEVTSVKTVAGDWTTVMPVYDSTSTTNNYYTCLLTKKNNSFKWTDLKLDYSIGIAHMAELLSSTLSPITQNGIYSNGTYNVILGNAATDKPMLIGSNGGLVIAAYSSGNTVSPVISMDPTNGILMYGSKIDLKAEKNSSTSAVHIGTDGIVLDSDKKLVVTTRNFELTADGTMTVRAGLIGDWSIISNRLTGTSSDGTLTVNLSAKNADSSGYILSIKQNATFEHPMSLSSANSFYEIDGTLVNPFDSSGTPKGQTVGGSYTLAGIRRNGNLFGLVLNTKIVRTPLIQLLYVPYNLAEDNDYSFKNMSIRPMYYSEKNVDWTEEYLDRSINMCYNSYLTGGNGFYIGYVGGAVVIGYRSSGMPSDSGLTGPRNARFLCFTGSRVFLYTVTRDADGSGTIKRREINLDNAVNVTTIPTGTSISTSNKVVID